MIGFILYAIYNLFIEPLKYQRKKVLKRLLVIAGILFTILFSTEITITLVKNHQVNKHMGFRTATPDTPDGELFIITRIVPGETMDLAGFQVNDQVPYRSVNDLYELLVNNQRKEVQIPIKRNQKELSIAVMVPEMEILGIKIWPMNKY
jgi:hypothetical protein